jgi:hypothetical protein
MAWWGWLRRHNIKKRVTCHLFDLWLIVGKELTRNNKGSRGCVSTVKKVKMKCPKPIWFADSDGTNPSSPLLASAYLQPYFLTVPPRYNPRFRLDCRSWTLIGVSTWRLVTKKPLKYTHSRTIFPGFDTQQYNTGSLLARSTPSSSYSESYRSPQCCFSLFSRNSNQEFTSIGFHCGWASLGIETIGNSFFRRLYFYK